MERLKVGIGRFRRFDLAQHNFGIAHGRRLIELVAELGRVQPSAAGKARIFQDGEIELDLGEGFRLGIGREHALRRQVEGGGVKTPIVRLADFGDRRLPLGREPHVGDPHRPYPLAVEGLERGEIVGVGTLAQYRVGKLRPDDRNHRICRGLGWRRRGCKRRLVLRRCQRFGRGRLGRW